MQSHASIFIIVTIMIMVMRQSTLFWTAYRLGRHHLINLSWGNKILHGAVAELCNIKL